jgi:plasmid stabilization system protein ParE
LVRHWKLDLKSAYENILEQSQSVEIAGRVRSDILSQTRELGLNPTVYEADRFRSNNDGSYRAFEKHSYRVTYRVIGADIRVFRVRHASMKPMAY